MNILEISERVAFNLNIDPKILIDIIEIKLNGDKQKMNEKISDPIKIKKIKELFLVDSKLFEFEEKNIKTEKVRTNFNELKNNLGKLQILVLIKNLEKTKDCDSILNVLLSTLNNKFETVNSILSNKLDQNGGSENYYNKYLKYKIKYLNLK
jgi:hypothetical protein